MTNREAHEKAAGMGLEDMFFRISGIDPNAQAHESCGLYKKAVAENEKDCDAQTFGEECEDCPYFKI